MENKNKPYLLTRSLHPENQESPIHFLSKSITPINYFYRRNHFSYPDLNHANVWLQLKTHESQPQFIHLNELLSLPARTILLPLECAGNKRAHFSPKVYGEQWEEGAISQGNWTGVSLKDVLKAKLLKVPSDSQEVIFKGADIGKRKNSDRNMPFKRSLPIEKALHPDTIIAYQYNHQPLSYKHGFPFRLIVPNWYAMASVKWLHKIEVISTTFNGPFQTEDYMYYPNKNDDHGKKPVTMVNVNSIIQQPTNYSILLTGLHEINGIAWTGQGLISEVAVSFDQGKSWKQAKLKEAQGDYSWVHWSIQCNFAKKGEYTIYSRALDTTGQMQPETAFWNRKGYGYNGVAKVHIKIE